LSNISYSPGSLPSAYFDFGFRYFVAGRFAASDCLHPVAANLLHHAVAMFLLGGICARTTGEEREKLGHDLDLIWNVFKDRLDANGNLARFDVAINALQDFEMLDHPFSMIRKAPSESLLDEVEALIKAVCSASGINRSATPR
jgi:hypothetical protein